MNAAQGPRPLFDSRWMVHAACTRIPGLPWTENRAPRLLVDLMGETCATSPVQEVCATFARETRVGAGWWAGSFRGPDIAVQAHHDRDADSDAA